MVTTKQSRQEYRRTPEYNVDKEKIFADIINIISVKKPDAMAEEIMRKSLKYNGGKPSDDMTVLVLGLFDTYDK